MFLLMLGFATAMAAHAQVLQQRQLPAQGKRGELGMPLPLPLIQIGSEVLRLAPGGVIYDQQNRTVIHAALPAAADVWYTTNQRGEVQRLYILAPEEQARLDRAAPR